MELRLLPIQLAQLAFSAGESQLDLTTAANLFHAKHSLMQAKKRASTSHISHSVCTCPFWQSGIYSSRISFFEPKTNLKLAISKRTVLPAQFQVCFRNLFSRGRLLVNLPGRRRRRSTCRSSLSRQKRPTRTWAPPSWAV